MILFYTPLIETNPVLPPEEAAHALRVLRLVQGDALDLTDGRGNFYKALIADTRGKQCRVEVTEKRAATPLWQGRLTIAVAPTKNMDRMEWFVEKAVEIGVDEIAFLNCRFSERRVIKTDRIEKIAVSAMKQSLKATLPQIEEMCDFDKFIARPIAGAKYIAHCYEEEKQLLCDLLQTGEPATLLIGPEGDFSPEEVEKALAAGYRPVSLGGCRLRTETAALVACHTYYLKNQL